ncbi:hypothetical protein VD0004_g5079 [Verticillium dahliae]|nr:hypothetical protein VD0004_g5079 [Verticillium dahliae]
MSRGGGRGGGRGGRGGRRGGGGPQLPWEGEDVDARPSELFPAYSVPEAKPLTSQETRSVSAFLLLRHQIHDGPLYTTRKLYTAADSAFSSSHKHYGQAQLNAKYAAGGGGARTKANQDPFTAVPTYAQRFLRAERTLPDFGARPYCPEFVPKELHATFEGADGPGGGAAGGGRKRKRGFQLSSIRALPTAEDVFGITLPEDEWDEEAGGEDATKRRLEALSRMGREPEGEEAEMGEDDEAEEEEQDEEYDDEDAGDYNAEEYFENGDDMDDDGGDDDQGGDAH